MIVYDSEMTFMFHLRNLSPHKHCDNSHNFIVHYDRILHYNSDLMHNKMVMMYQNRKQTLTLLYILAQ